LEAKESPDGGGEIASIRRERARAQRYARRRDCDEKSDGFRLFRRLLEIYWTTPGPECQYPCFRPCRLEVEGSVTIGEKLELRSTARIRGSLKARSIAVAKGAIIEGDMAVTSGKPVVHFEEKRGAG